MLSNIDCATSYIPDVKLKKSVGIYPNDLVQVNNHKVKVNCLEYRARKWCCTAGTD